MVILLLALGLQLKLAIEPLLGYHALIYIILLLPYCFETVSCSERVHLIQVLNMLQELKIVFAPQFLLHSVAFDIVSDLLKMLIHYFIVCHFVVNCHSLSKPDQVGHRVRRVNHVVASVSNTLVFLLPILWIRICHVKASSVRTG